MHVNLELVAKDACKATERTDIVIVIDVLRCTSSIITALTNGANAIIPVQTVADARSKFKDNPNYILAGERRGVKPKGFSLGNSPLEFTQDRVAGKTIIMTTTSGTATFARVKSCPFVLVGALLNASAIAHAARNLSEQHQLDISVALSGNQGAFSLEDFIGAGAIIHHFTSKNTTYSDAAYASLLTFQKARQSLFTALSEGTHAKTLFNLGFMDDVVYCTQLNKYFIVPSLQGEVIVSIP